MSLRIRKNRILTGSLKKGEVVGLTIQKAIAIIKDANLHAAFELGPETTELKNDKTIARQAPEPGMEINLGSTVKLFIYSLKVKDKTIPKLIGLYVAEVQQVLRKMGLSIDPELGKNASEKNNKGRIYKQSPQPQIMISAGVTVTVWIYGEPQQNKIVQEQSEQTAANPQTPVGYPGTHYYFKFFCFGWPGKPGRVSLSVSFLNTL